MKPDEMERADVLKGVLKNYARFYLRKALFEYPFIKGDKLKRRYMLGCLKAFMKSTATKKFYDLERLKFRGTHTDVDFGFDRTKVLSRDQIAALKAEQPEMSADVNYTGPRMGAVPPSPVTACGAPNDLHHDERLAPGANGESIVESAGTH
jgi:anaerobic magnesium-protoporphyrin IX monomethyl ester cyclase